MDEKTMYEAVIAHKDARIAELSAALARLVSAARDVDVGYLDQAIEHADNALAGQQQQGEPCEFHGDDFAACQMYSGQIPCEPEPEAEQPAAVDGRGSFIPDYQRMFNGAVMSLVLIGEAVGVRGEDQLNGHLEIMEAIHKIKSRRDSWRNIAEKSGTLFSAIEHGDNDHRNWLRSAISAHFSGIAVPAPYGLGAKELIENENAQLRVEIENLRGALAPAAVVMPERMTTIPEGKTISYAAGYEAALDAVANLNQNTVPLELLERIANKQDAAAFIGQEQIELRAILAGGKP